MWPFRSWILPGAAAFLTMVAVVREVTEDSAVTAVRSEALHHYQVAEYPAFVDRMEALVGDTRSDVDTYNLACGYALSGEPQKALATLREVVARGAVFDLGKDADLRSLHRYPEFHQLVALSAYFEEVNERLEPIRDTAMEHYREGRYDVFVLLMERVAGYSRNDVDIYNLACGYALMGRADEAIAQLEIVAERGVDHGAATDRDFRSLRRDPRFRALVLRFQDMD